MLFEWNMCQLKSKKEEQILELSPEQKVRYLLKTGEAENDTVRRATDLIWPMETYNIKSVSKSEYGFFLISFRRFN